MNDLPAEHRPDERPDDRPHDRPVGWYVDRFESEAERFAIVLDGAGNDEMAAPVEACPGWSLERLAEHLGQIHRWAAFCVSNGRPPTDADAAALESFEPSRAAEWFREGAGALAATLRRVEPDGPTWHPFPVATVAKVWPRRQAHETAIHRWDAERAVGEPSAFDPELASDGIDEYFEIALPRLMVREGITLPTGSLHVHCTDVEGEWLVWDDGGRLGVIRAHQKGDAALRGPAEAILLRLWGRTSPLADQLSPVGDEAVLAAWLAIAGM